MKTTIDLPDALADRAKRVAHARGTTLRALVIQGLTDAVQDRPDDSLSTFRMHTFAGRGLKAGVDPARLTEMAYE